MAQRIIFHLDMDSFFSAIEQREEPELEGRPVVVGADPRGGKGRGVVSTASYEAREYGVHSAQPISKAYRLCPQCVFLPVRHRLYTKVSDRIMHLLRKHAVNFQQVSIDEAYIEVTGRVESYSQAEGLARRIKNEIHGKEKLTCSIGIAPNKMVAKIASDHQKPDGLTVIRPGEVEGFLAPLRVGKIPGIGPKSQEALKAMGIETIGRLAETDVQRLMPHFGRESHRLVSAARGVDEREVGEGREVKSVGRQKTFQEDITEEENLQGAVEKVAEQAHRDLIEGRLLFKTLTLIIRFSDFETLSRAKSLKSFHGDLRSIKGVARELLSEFQVHKGIRLLGIRLSNLKKRQQVTLDDYL